jgi:hypothetical protein
VTTRDQGARPAVVAHPLARARPAAPAALRPAARSLPAGSVGRDNGRSQAPVDRHSSGPSGSAKAKAVTGTGALPAQASHKQAGAKGQALGQATASNGRRAEPKAAKDHPAHPATGRSPAPSVPGAHPTHPEHPAAPAAPASKAPSAGAQDGHGPADATPPGSSGTAHAVK